MIFLNPAILKIRLIQLKRQSNALGLFYCLFYLLLFILLTIILFEQFNKSPNCFYVTGGFGLLLSSIHMYRKDLRFADTSLLHPFSALVTEYVILSLPILFIPILTPNWYCSAILLILILIVSYIRIPLLKTSVYKFLSRFLTYGNFEMVSGIRTQFYPILILFLAGLGLSFIKFISLFVIWFLALTMTGFYLECEPLNILQLWQRDAKDFLIYKIIAHSKLFFTILLPIILSYLIFNPTHWWVALFMIVFMWIGLIFNITLKYSSYQPNQKLSTNSFLMALGACCILVPFLLPLPLIMTIRNFKLSIRKITSYLND